MEERSGVHVIIRGRVQGVGFRQFVQHCGRKLDLAGWARNLPDGKSVEIEAEGPRERLEQLIERVRTGPAGSSVDEIDIQWTTPRGLPALFEIRR